MTFTPIDATGFIGQGIIFPIVLVNGAAKISTGFELLNSDLKNIVAFPIGTRIMMGEYGSRIWDLVEEQNSTALQQLLRTFFQDAIAEWETRIIFVDIQFSYPSPTAVNITYWYKVSSKAPVQSFVFPFYKNIIA